MAAPPELLLRTRRRSEHASHSGGNMCAFCACGEWDTLCHRGALGPHTHTHSDAVPVPVGLSGFAVSW